MLKVLNHCQSALPSFVTGQLLGMDIGRTVLRNYLPKSRLDAGTFGTMGVGFGQTIAAKAVFPERKVCLVIGDSAFGFSGMELEVLHRYNMPRRSSHRD